MDKIVDAKGSSKLMALSKNHKERQPINKEYRCNQAGEAGVDQIIKAQNATLRMFHLFPK